MGGEVNLEVEAELIIGMETANCKRKHCTTQHTFNEQIFDISKAKIHSMCREAYIYHLQRVVKIGNYRKISKLDAIYVLIDWLKWN